MDSYEYYLLYHQNRNQFNDSLSKDNKEILISLSKLSRNKKIEEDRCIYFDKIVNFIKNDTKSDFFLDELLEELISLKIFHEYIDILFENELDFSKLRIAKVFVNFMENISYIDDNMSKISELLIDCIFRNSSLRLYAVGILYDILRRNEELKYFILTKIVDISSKRNDPLSLENICYFFKKWCQSNFYHESSELLEYYFRNDSGTIRKQGIFLVKCLIEYNLMNEVDTQNWNSFIIIIESLEENQSHLILPSLKLLYEMNVYENFEKFWFILCTLIINHDNVLVKSYGLNYLFGLEGRKFQEYQVLKILEALNVTYLYDQNENNFLEKIQNFINSNVEAVFRLLIEINWFSVPLYYVLRNCYNINVSHYPNSSAMKELLNCIENQTAIIPKRIRNIKIRAMIKELYANLLERIMQKIDIQCVLPILNNIFHIDNNNDYLDKCLTWIKTDDYDSIFNNANDYEFIKYVLLKTHAGRALDEIKRSISHVKNNRKLLMEVMCELNKLEVDEYDEQIPNILISETIELFWVYITEGDSENLANELETLEIGLKAAKNGIEHETLDHIIELWMKIYEKFRDDSKYEYAYLRFCGIVLKYNIKFDTKLLEKEIFSNKTFGKNLLFLTYDQVLIMKNNVSIGLETNEQYMEIVMENIEALMDIASVALDIYNIYDILDILILSMSENILSIAKVQNKLELILRTFISISSNIIDLKIEFWIRLLKITWSLIKFPNGMALKISTVLETILNDLNGNDRFSFLMAIYNFIKESKTHLQHNILLNFFKNSLVEALFDVDVMSRDEQIENSLLCKDQEISQRLKFRLEIAQFFSDIYANEFCVTIENKILEFSEISKKKVRYYPNSKIHRQKLRYFQPLVFLKSLNENVINALIYELLWINNQLNVIYILEIILAAQNLDVLNLLHNSNKELNSQALKSIFSIIIMEIKAEKKFEKAEIMLDEIFKNVFPFSMGQNFGVRIYSMLTIVLSFEHVKSLLNFRESLITSKISDICDIILESVKQKNCLKYFNALKNDFRFNTDINELKKYQVIYGDIPFITKMPFEEVILNENKTNKVFFAADMNKETDCIVMIDEIEIKNLINSNPAAVSLQRKYLPMKNQIPGENLLKNLPERFKIYDENEGILKPKSDLIVVASLIDNNTNLGGLARTGEIFGISKYVIHSLKSQENFEFKQLSRTSEKWINISEIKDWQLFDYLIGMKQSGYIIAGAEQSNSSVSLLNVKFPKKCVFLLGNEKKGIPSDLLGLLDIIVEIPQIGVVRSLNVHVAGAILIWEYAKQHTFQYSSIIENKSHGLM